jgi:hypothetical protein
MSAHQITNLLGQLAFTIDGTKEFPQGCRTDHTPTEEATMGFGRGVLLWLIGIPLPIIILLALFMHH